MNIFKNAKFDIIIGCIVLLVSFAVIGWGTYNFIENEKAYDNFVKTQATIIDYEVREMWDDMEKKYYYTPIIEFEAQGEIYQLKDAETNDPKDIGEKITIYYNPENPEDFVTPENNKQNAILLFVFGIIAMIVGLGFAIDGIKIIYKDKVNLASKTIDDSEKKVFD